jgi:hypothetical protein
MMIIVDDSSREVNNTMDNNWFLAVSDQIIRTATGINNNNNDNNNNNNTVAAAGSSSQHIISAYSIAYQHIYNCKPVV